MPTAAIRVESLSKQYDLGAAYRRSDMLREQLTHGLRSWLSRSRPRHERTIWALRDLSFSVVPGEVFGVIGRNGAGKSTLLKVLSRITHPTSGRIEVNGRVASLLEVGTGFHPELSGRENVFLNGAILGMSKAEINRKFDEIVAFAELGQFIDIPVKRYSSGMSVRLAFSVAAHLEPDILLLDEVLAVGDESFQQKCFETFASFREERKTIVLVTHTLELIRRFGDRALLLSGGHVQALGPPEDVIERYHHELAQTPDASSVPFVEATMT
jgi:homopolymeric O-antigen transport system ATP-binding protein